MCKKPEIHSRFPTTEFIHLNNNVVIFSLLLNFSFSIKRLTENHIYSHGTIKCNILSRYKVIQFFQKLKAF